MTLRKGHGTGAKALVRVETLPVDELPAGVPGDARTECPTDRGTGGRFARGNSLAAEGGKAKRGKGKLAGGLGLSPVADTNEFRPYRASAATYRRVQCNELAQTVGGGVCGPGPAAIVASAALALAWSRFWSDKAAETGDAELAVRALAAGDKHRQALLTATELCAREAKARKETTSTKPDAWFEQPSDAEGETS